MARDIAIDVHKRTLFVVAADAEGVEWWHRRFPTTLEGEAPLLRELGPEDRVVLEATCGVHRLAHRLESTGAKVVVADAQHCRLLGMRGKKTDYRDCRALLSHLRSGEVAPVWRPDATTRKIRQLTRERAAYNQGIVRLKNRIHALLWEEGLVAPCRLFTAEGAAWLSAQALPEVTRRIVAREWQVLGCLLPMKALQEEELTQLALTLPAAQQLMQIDGFGAPAAVMWLGEVGEVARFGSAAQLASYAGLNPRVDQSGDRVRTGPITKAGRRSLRWIMVEVAWRHVNSGGSLAEYFQRLVKRGKKPQVAIVAVARKLLVLAYLLLTRGETYRPLKTSCYERKLAELAACRPQDVEPEQTNVGWAAARLKAWTGLDSPYRQAHPVASTRRPRRQASRGRHATQTGGAPTAPVGFDEFPALEGSDPSSNPTDAGLVWETDPATAPVG
jgi:transposase